MNELKKKKKRYRGQYLASNAGDRAASASAGHQHVELATASLQNLLGWHGKTRVREGGREGERERERERERELRIKSKEKQVFASLCLRTSAVIVRQRIAGVGILVQNVRVGDFLVQADGHTNVRLGRIERSCRGPNKNNEEEEEKKMRPGGRGGGEQDK